MKYGAQKHLQFLASTGFWERMLEYARGAYGRAGGNFIHGCLSLPLTLGNWPTATKWLVMIRAMCGPGASVHVTTGLSSQAGRIKTPGQKIRVAALNPRCSLNISYASPLWESPPSHFRLSTYQIRPVDVAILLFFKVSEYKGSQVLLPSLWLLAKWVLCFWSTVLG